ncbi:hypothetical protein [Parabacteroides chinchillae]|uniref:Uncharacterized protein n=1 Tax=Parabacteroides chinchillae TaxID=871327 RepID=A0A8G2F5G7_9BACT|nr:hypothetical protein [Parabacteroides chinchillae]SEG02495.1 hypothetical protein SAMN05444001_11284 [Parabacteroides chinchillae]
MAKILTEAGSTHVSMHFRDNIPVEMKNGNVLKSEAPEYLNYSGAIKPLPVAEITVYQKLN